MSAQNKTVYIPLTQGKYTLVDDTDFEWLSQWKWHLGRDGYARRTEYLGIFDKKSKCRAIYLHKLIHPTKTESGEFSDHINGDKLDNRHCNLRVATKSQNNSNKEKLKNNTSGYKGVWRDKSRNKWATCIRLNGRTIHLGRRDTPEEAAQLYTEAAKKYFGAFARV